MGSRSSSSNTTKNKVTNYSLQGMEQAGSVVAGSENNVNVTVTDMGAIQSAFGFGDSALESNTAISTEALKTNESVSKYAIDRNTDLAGKTVSFSENAIERGFDMSRSIVDQNTANSANTMLAIKELAQSIKSGGATDLINQSNKTVYTFGAIFAVVILGVLLISWGKK